MGRFILQRVLTFIPILLIMSLVIFFIIQLPPGDYLTSYVAGLKAEGQIVDESELNSLKERYGLDQPWFMQYFKWMGNIITRFDFGYSFEYEKPVWPVIAEVLPMTMIGISIRPQKSPRPSSCHHCRVPCCSPIRISLEYSPMNAVPVHR